MPRRLLRDRRVVVDDWRYAGEPDLGAALPADAAASLIVTFEQWQADPGSWIARGGRLGVVLSPDHKIEQLAPDLAWFALVAAKFPGPADGRGYSQGRQLRENHQFNGELRAIGYVRRDQLFFLARCGFNSFELAEDELAEDELAGAASWLRTFSAAYQPSNDAGLPLKLRRDIPASA
jgi:uncharacterized protein (DUF934 family)